MSITSTLDQTRKDIQKTLEERNPLLAVAGFGDAAVKKLRETSADLSARAEKFDPKSTLEQAQASIVARVGSLQDDILAAPAKAQALVGESVASAVGAYGDLADRGQGLIAKVRGQQATTDLKEQASTTVSKVKAASTTAKKSASATKTAAKSTRTTAKKSASATMTSAKSTRTTAKKSAAKTKTATKSAATSAKKAATASKKAVADGAGKVGS